MHPSSRPHTQVRRRLLAVLLVLCAFLGFVLFSATAQAHGPGHHHPETAQKTSVRSAHSAAETTKVDAEHQDEHGHHHSGDPIKDLLTLGHNHVGGTVSGLPPALWFLAAMPHATQSPAAWPERAPGNSPPDNPFRPPIA